MLTAYVGFAVLALLGLGLAAAWFSGALSARRAERYVPIGLLGRRYVVWFPVPRRRKVPVPVVLAFHAGGSTVEDFEAAAALHRTQAATGFAVLYPEGYHGTWNAGRCCGDALLSEIDDLAFVRAILDDLETLLTIDRRRVYATGFGNGAMLCYRLACELSDEIAAIAPVAGPMWLDACRPSRPVAVLHLHGLDDREAPFTGGRGDPPDAMLPPVADGIAFWREVNATGTVQHERLFGGAADCALYPAAPDGAEIRVCTLPGLGHRWPGSSAVADSADARSNPIARDMVNDAILRFLARHSLPQARARRIRIDPAAP